MLRSILILLLCLPLTVMAHGDHGVEGNPYKEFGVPIESKQAREFSAFIVDRLVERGKLDFSWQEAEWRSAAKQRFGQENEWVVNYHNAQEQDAGKQNLYIFLSIYGEYMGANFTGR